MTIHDDERLGELSRREFLRRCACAAAGGAAFASTFGQFQLASAALPAGDAFDDYRAVVCVFLFGGNDSANMFVPMDTAAYDVYATSRQNLAVPRSDLQSVNATNVTESYGFHPSCSEMRSLFANGNMAVLANVGTLLQPTTRQEYLDRTANLPPQLFSHNDQTAFWQALQKSSGRKTGWSGRMADLLANRIPSTEQQFAMNISLSGTNLLQTGGTSVPYNVSSRGVTSLRGMTGRNAREDRRKAAFDKLLDASRTSSDPFIREFGAVQRRARDSVERIGAALDALTPLATTFPTSRLGEQLNMVSRLIQIRSTLNVRRQVFFVGMGGFDTHGAQATRQPDLLQDLSTSLNAFYAATVELGLEDNVVTFTNSEFGRTLTSNGDGSDHGWGGHQVILGGSVDGGKLFGTFPTLEIRGPDDTRGGRLIPTTSADQFGATIARWFGVPDGDLNSIFPNLNNFTNRNLGFMG